MPKNKGVSSTDESVFTLLSLYVLISQAFESLFGKEDILHSDFTAKARNFQDLVNDTIHEALVYQILLKTCAYLDEWNSVLGVKTEIGDRNTILVAKQIAKPAYKCVASWKHLRDFRNHAIAHNHRDNEGKNIYLNPRKYHSPQTNGEIYLLVYCLEKMTDVINFFFPDAAARVMEVLPKRPRLGKQKFLGKRQIIATIKEIDNHISDHLMRQHLVRATIKSLPPDGASVTVL